MLVAHRGFKNKNKENRMIDFKTALLTCKAVEFDLCLTKDKKIIIFHDNDFSRIGNKKIKVKDINYDEIKKIPFFENNPEYIPPLFIEDFIYQLANQYQMINVEIKSARYSQEDFDQFTEALNILRIMTKAEIIVSSFNRAVLKWIVTLKKSRFHKGYLFWRQSAIDWKMIRKFDYVHPSITTVKKEKNIELFTKINLPMLIWTFKKDTDVIKVKKLYNDNQIYAFISDNKDLKT